MAKLLDAADFRKSKVKEAFLLACPVSYNSRVAYQKVKFLRPAAGLQSVKIQAVVDGCLYSKGYFHWQKVRIVS